ncbi:MAG: hypothetical protein R2911_45860, partial [Caldilineaceae bacterium]
MSETETPASEGESLVPLALAQDTVVNAPVVAALTDGEPVVEQQVEPTVEQHAIQDSYCMWPGDTLSDIAYFSNVDEPFIQALNPEYTGGAGSNVLLPAGSTPPVAWSAPLPIV